MEFWDQFIKESLQSPWVIRPEGAADSVESQWHPHTRIFVIENDLPDDAYQMLGKMVAALKYDPAAVLFLENLPGNMEALKGEVSDRILLFFGQDFPGQMGEAMNWSGHQIVKTHSVQSLLDNANLKKETWAHLKLFASLK